MTLCFWLAGAPDPNALGYSDEGWTGALLRTERLRRRRLGRVVLRAGQDPLLASDGQERGPIEIRYSTESRSQPETVAWLRGVG